MGPVGGLEITTEVENDKTVLTLDGKVTIGAGDVKLRKAIRDLLDQGVRNMVIDLHDVTRFAGNRRERQHPSVFQDLHGRRPVHPG